MTVLLVFSFLIDRKGKLRAYVENVFKIKAYICY